MDPPFTGPSSYIFPAHLPYGPIPGGYHPMHYPHVTGSESTGDAPWCQAYNCAKEKVQVASYPVLNARIKTALFECDICKATFTRKQNFKCLFRLSSIVIHIYRSDADHRDAHFGIGIKKHSSLCGGKFFTLSGSKRHEHACLTCRAAKNPSKDSPSG